MKMKVISFSNLEANPYGKALAENLRLRGIQIEEYFPRIFFLPIFIGWNKCHILHLHTIHYFFHGKTRLRRWLKFVLFVLQILILKFLGTKIVWTVHEWSDKVKSKRDDTIYQSWARILGFLFNGIITHCKSTKIDIAKALQLQNEDKICIIPHANYIGLYEEVVQIEARRSLDVSNTNLVFLIFGNLIRAKGFLEAIDAFKQIPQEKISLLIAGYPVEDDIERLILEKIDGFSNIKFKPEKIPHDEVSVYMCAADCVLVPYKTFTTSGVTILAMSFGKSCIAPRIGYFNDVLDDLGSFLYNSDNEHGLLQAMQFAASDREKLLKMGRHNLELAKQWSWDHIAEETLSFYHLCLDGH